MSKEVFLSEKELVETLRTNRTFAISELYDKYSGALLFKILYIVERTDLAEQVLKDVFVEAWRTAVDYNPNDRRLFTWILNLAVKHAKKTLKIIEENSNRKDLQNQQHINYTTFNNDEKNEYCHLRAEELLNYLDLELSEVFYTVYFLGNTLEEASEILRSPLEVIKCKIRMAILELRKIYSQEFH
ncbi:hypothetical protein [Pedobacter sp. WC2423]|uniref:hypothetical protein n=1 Tax=Pedobacter sp. WC2423 TaxID=3234142 RepID=UPI003465F67A